MNIFKEHQYLLMRRESRDVLGRKAINLWLLILVFAATFFSIAFSAGSMAYLDEKMNDPFTNWVNIDRGQDTKTISQLRIILDDDSIRQHFSFNGVQTEISSSLGLITPSGQFPLFSMLHYEDMTSDLIHAVLSDDNVVGGVSIVPDSISKHTLGIIMTYDAFKRSGYSLDNVPALVNLPCKAPGADSLGYELLDEDYVRAPLPLLAVVKRLPMNKDMVASKYMYQQYHDTAINGPFYMNNEEYVRILRFFVPEEVVDFEHEALQYIPDSLRRDAIVHVAEESVQDRLRSWKKGCVMTVYVGTPTTPLPVLVDIEKRILNNYSKDDVMRVYHYNESTENIFENPNEGGMSMSSDDDIISAHFERLDSIRPFERFIKEVSGLQIEMSQVNAKENFKAVSNMADVLSIAMIVFSITSIIIFIINMLQSYFHKVRRNLGTFKAFGLSIKELMKVYVAINVAMVVLALIVSLCITWLTELLLCSLGVMKDGMFSWLVLWNGKTLFAIIIILASTILSVFFVMRRLLQQTPGNLIYDR